MLQHFPSRQTDKDAVIIGDLAADCIEAGVSESALSLVCQQIRHEASSDSPFLPPTGEVLRRAKSRTEYENRPRDQTYSRPETRMADPAPVNAVPWYGVQWNDFTREMLGEFQEHMRKMDAEDRKKADGYRLFMRNNFGMPKDAA